MPPDIRVYNADSRDVLLTLEPASIDSVVCDPPYALVSILKRFGGANAAPAQEGTDGRYRRASVGFMGQSWDTGETAHDPEFWAEVARVLKPGAHLLAFGGTRTYHRMACAIEDAGFEVRDMVAWLYGTGFPKSHDMAKAIEDMAFAAWLELNPDHKLSFIGAIQVAEAGSDKDEIDRIVAHYHELGGPYLDAIKWEGWGTAIKPALEPIILARLPIAETSIARNVVEYGTGALNIDASRIDADGRNDPNWRRAGRNDAGGVENDRLSLARQERLKPESLLAAGRWPANVAHDGSDEVLAAFPDLHGAGSQREAIRSATEAGMFGLAGGDGHRFGDSGSAARFFFSAKAGKIDRWGSKHPTVKPIDLIRWFIRMVTPPGGTVLDPFAGSGTAGVAALAEGMNAILIERNADYASDIEERLAHYRGEGKHSLASRGRHKADKPGSLL